VRLLLLVYSVCTRGALRFFFIKLQLLIKNIYIYNREKKKKKKKKKEMRNLMYILTTHNKPEKDQTPFTMLVMVAEDRVRFSDNQQIC
jgi:hypothetical protein